MTRCHQPFFTTCWPTDLYFDPVSND